MAEPRGDPAGYELAFEEGKRALAEQADVLKDTRDRVGTVFSAAAVVAGVGAGFALNTAAGGGGIGALGSAAIVVGGIAFAALTFAAAMIWRPSGAGNVIDAGVVVGGYLEAEPPASIVEVHRELAVHLGRHSVRNARFIEARLRWFNVALFALVVEVVSFIGVLADVA